jgi:hypothetical protein
MHAVKPNAKRFLTVRIFVRQRPKLTAVIPLLAGNRARMAADADIEINDQTQLLRGWRGQ